MDCGWAVAARAALEVDMDRDERAELVTRLFALMTSKLEDAAADAMQGQSGIAVERDQIKRAERIELLARDVGLIAESTAAIIRPRPERQQS